MPGSPNINGEPTDVWMSMADHFLDTETRHDLPLTAWCCLRAGLSVAEARDIWRNEVTPAVGVNMLSVAGEWAGWPDDWLFERIRVARRAGPVRRLWRRAFNRVNASSWQAVERCMCHLLSIEADKREERARDLAAVARHAFDFVPEKVETMGPAKRERLRALYPAPFLTLMASVFYGGDHEHDLTGRF